MGDGYAIDLSPPGAAALMVIEPHCRIRGGSDVQQPVAGSEDAIEKISVSHGADRTVPCALYVHHLLHCGALTCTDAHVLNWAFVQVTT